MRLVVNSCAPKMALTINVVVEALVAVLIKDDPTETKVATVFSLSQTKRALVEEGTKLVVTMA